MTTLAATGVLRASWLLLAFPVFGAAVLLIGGRRTNRWGHLLGCAMPLASFVYGVIAFFTLLGYPAAERSRDLHLYSWIPVGTFQANIGILLDPLSICFVLLITGVGSLIIIYSVGYMAHDSERRRFFGYMNLFLASMLLLVLADNYLVLYVGWEGVGLTSYLLIGFWQYKPAAATAAKKAFVANRVGDLGMSIAIMLMFATFGSVTFSGVFSQVGHAGAGVTTALGLLLLLGACGKSAQLPLQSWLLDAMEGPTPVSALIHAATMVTAGVYLLVRSNPILAVAPDARIAIAVVGTVTLLVGGIIASARDDIKKSLAGSTMSQIGYMTLGAGLGPEGYVFSIALLLCHGFYKAGLFLGAGSVIHGMDDEQNMREYGGLDPRPLRADRRGPHRVLHDPDDVHDLVREAALGGGCRRAGRDGTGETRAPSARIASGDDVADDRARDRLGGRGRVPHHQRPAGEIPRPELPRGEQSRGGA